MSRCLMISGLVALSAALAAPAWADKPLVLYTPLPEAAAKPAATATATAATAAATHGTAAACGTLQAPCQGLDPSDLTTVAPVFDSGVKFGMSGVVTAGVSNLGYGGGVGVQGWLQKDDFTIVLGLYTSYDKWNHNAFDGFARH